MILHDQIPKYLYSMPLIHQVITFQPHASFSRMLYQLVLRGCSFITWQAAVRSYYSYTSTLSECWLGFHSDSRAIFYKDWSGTSPNRTRPPELVGSSHRHQPGLTSVVLPPRLDRSDYSEPWWQMRLTDNEWQYRKGKNKRFFCTGVIAGDFQQVGRMLKEKKFRERLKTIIGEFWFSKMLVG